MRLLRDVLPAGPPTLPRTFDLLIVDEVHGCAPSGQGRYATDSLRTAAIHTIAPHFEHRLFLSATPHNGYPGSFEALWSCWTTSGSPVACAPTRSSCGG